MSPIATLEPSNPEFEGWIGGRGSFFHCRGWDWSRISMQLTIAALLFFFFSPQGLFSPKGSKVQSGNVCFSTFSLCDDHPKELLVLSRYQFKGWPKNHHVLSTSDLISREKEEEQVFYPLFSKFQKRGRSISAFFPRTLTPFLKALGQGTNVCPGGTCVLESQRLKWNKNRQCFKMWLQK